MTNSLPLNMAQSKEWVFSLKKRRFSRVMDSLPEGNTWISGKRKNSRIFLKQQKTWRNLSKYLDISNPEIYWASLWDGQIKESQTSMGPSDGTSMSWAITRAGEPWQLGLEIIMFSSNTDANSIQLISYAFIIHILIYLYIYIYVCVYMHIGQFPWQTVRFL